MRDTIADLASPAGLLLKSLLPHDPTGETLHIIDQTAAHAGAAAAGRRLGVRATASAPCCSPKPRPPVPIPTRRSTRSTRSGRHSHAAVRDVGASARASRAANERPRRICRRRAGEHRARGRAAVDREQRVDRHSAAARCTARCRRSLLGLLPVATGALVGIAAVALGFGAVHGITLGFGVTLIGESVDYSIYFFVQSARGGTPAAAPGSGGCGRPFGSAC